MIGALVFVLAAWLGFILFLIGVLAIGEWWARRAEKPDPLEAIWMLPPAERHNDRRAA